MRDETGMIVHAASIIKKAEVFIITAGAGMGVDSGLPDFRGDHGFWKTYSAYDRLGLYWMTVASRLPARCGRTTRRM